MKRKSFDASLMLVSAFVLISYTVSADGDSKKIIVGFGLGFGKSNIPTENKRSVWFDFEPAYRVTENLTIGLQFESAATGLHLDDSPDYSINSFTANCQYNLVADIFRPFIGTGLGVYTLTNEGVQASRFGVYPRIGFDLGHFTALFEYNFIFGSHQYPFDVSKYFGIRIGFHFGGGTSKSSPTSGREEKNREERKELKGQKKVIPPLE